MVLPLLAAAGGIASGIGSIFGASAQEKAARNALNEQRKQFNYQKGLVEPMYERGQSANALLDAVYGVGYDDPANLADDRQNFMNSFEASPIYQTYYQTGLDNANNAILKGQAARGMANSGATLKALQDRASEIGGNTLNNYLAGITGISNQGAGAATSLSGASQNFGNAAANLIQNKGAAQAAMYQGAGNSVNNAIGAYGYQNALSKYGPQSVSAFGGGL